MTDATNKNVQDASDTLVQVKNSAGALIDGLMAKGQGVVDGVFPPQQRAHSREWLSDFAASNPKLSAFLLTNIALTGVPLVLFSLFATTVLVVSLVVALFIGLLAALLFTTFWVGVALIILLPTIFFTTFVAVSIFLWGLAGYYVFNWFNDSSPHDAKPKTINGGLDRSNGRA